MPFFAYLLFCCRTVLLSNTGVSTNGSRRRGSSVTIFRVIPSFPYTHCRTIGELCTVLRQGWVGTGIPKKRHPNATLDSGSDRPNPSFGAAGCVAECEFNDSRTAGLPLFRDRRPELKPKRPAIRWGQAESCNTSITTLRTRTGCTFQPAPISESPFLKSSAQAHSLLPRPRRRLRLRSHHDPKNNLLDASRQWHLGRNRHRHHVIHRRGSRL